jgi:hypothetical protein
MGTQYIANLEAPLSPHAWLLALGGDHFAVVAGTILMSWVGVYGCWRLTRRLGLGSLAFTLLTVLTGFNGALVAHVSAGHLSWLGLYLLPLVAEGLLVVAGGGRSAARAASWLALGIFALLLAGWLHIALIFIGLIGLSLIAVPRMRAPLAVCLAQAALLSTFRMLPAAAAFWRGGRQWIAGGYQPLQMLDAMLSVRAPGTPVETPATLAFGFREPVMLTWIEFDAYVGAIGTLLLVVFAVATALRAFTPASPHEPALRAIALPSLLLAGFSLWHFYAALVVAPLSLLSAQRVPSRFFGVALCFGLVVAIGRFDTWWRARPRTAIESALAWAAAGLAAGQLAYHSVTYSPARRAIYPVALTAADPVLTSASGGMYVAAMVAGAVVTTAALAWTLSRLRS